MQSCDFESNPILTCRIETFVVSHWLMVVVISWFFSWWLCLSLSSQTSMFCYSILIFTDMKSRLSPYFCLKTGLPLGTVGCESRPGLKSLHCFDIFFFPLSISALWYFIFSRLHSSHSDLHCSLLSPFFVLSSLISWGLGVSSRHSVWCCAASFLTPRRWSLPTEALSTHTWVF